MSWGTDFANAFIAGYQIAPSKLDDAKKQADIDNTNATTENTKARTSAIPTDIELTKAQTAAARANAAQSGADVSLTGARAALLQQQAASAASAARQNDAQTAQIPVAAAQAQKNFELQERKADIAQQRQDTYDRLANPKDPSTTDWSGSDTKLGDIFGVTPATEVPVQAPAASPAPVTPQGNSAIPGAPSAMGYADTPQAAPPPANPDDATTAVDAAASLAQRQPAGSKSTPIIPPNASENTADATPNLANAPPAKLEVPQLSAALIAGAKDISTKAGMEGAIAPDPATTAKAVDDLHAGAGAMPKGMFSAIMDKVDPQNLYPIGTKAAIALGQIMQSPDMSPAEKAHYAGQLMQTTRLGFNQYAMIANEAGKNGQITDALQAAAHAYNMIPSGMTVTAVNLNKDGAYELAMRNDKTGEISTEPLMSPADVAAGKLHITPQMYDQMLSDTIAGGQAADKTILPQADQAAVEAALRSGKADPATYAGLTEKGRNAVDQALTNYGKNTNGNDNAAPADQAAVAMTTLTDALTTKNMAQGTTSDALAANKTALTTNLTKWFKSDTSADPSVVGTTIASMLVPGAMAAGLYSKSPSKREGFTDITSQADGSVVQLPDSIIKDITAIELKRDMGERDKLRGQTTAGSESQKRLAIGDQRAFPDTSTPPDQDWGARLSPDLSAQPAAIPMRR